MLKFGASKPRVKGGPGPPAPPGSAPEVSFYSEFPLGQKIATEYVCLFG